MTSSENNNLIEINTISLASKIFEAVHSVNDSLPKEVSYLLCDYIDEAVYHTPYKLRDIVSCKNLIIKSKSQVNETTVLDQELLLFIFGALNMISTSKFSFRDIEVIFKELNIKVCFSGSGLGNSYEHIRKTNTYLAETEHGWCFETEWESFIYWLNSTGTNKLIVRRLSSKGIRNKRKNNYYYEDLVSFKRNLGRVFKYLYSYDLAIQEVEFNYKTLHANHDDCELSVVEHMIQVLISFEEFGNIGLGRNGDAMNLVCSRLKDEGGHIFQNSIYWPQSDNAKYRTLNIARKNNKLTSVQKTLIAEYDFLHEKLITKQSKMYSELIEGNISSQIMLEH